MGKFEPIHNISNAVESSVSSSTYQDQTKTGDFYNGYPRNTDGSTNNESSWTTDWERWHGYYLDVPLFAAVIDTISAWTVGKGYKTDEKTQLILDKINGMGKDDFNSIIENLLRTCLIGGDSFAEIVRDKAGRLTNLKPLNPARMKSVFNSQGIISRYEQIDTGIIFKPKEIFHLCWNRLADEIHGKPFAEREESIIKQLKQLQEDLGIRFHRIVKPIRLYEADTDNPTELAAIEAKLANAYKKADHIVIPKGSLEQKEYGPTPSALDAIAYINDLIRAFITSCNCPEVILGWSVGTTDASAKIVYLSFQQPTERKQKFLEEQLRIQMGIKLDFEFPASLEPALTTAGGNLLNAPKNNTLVEDQKKAKKLNTPETTL